MDLLSPEEKELNKKRSLLDRLKDRLANKEEELADLRAELEQFEAQYTMEVGRLYAELDEIDARIAEEEVRVHPDDDEIRRKAEDARHRAEESAAQAEAENWDGCTFKWQPTIEAKKAYHKLARLIHPDLALDERERERRHDLMAKLNDAYAAGDQVLLNKLVEDHRDSPDLISGDSVSDELIRAIRQISQVKNRLNELNDESLKLELSELFVLQNKVRNEMLEGRNLLKQMAARTRTQIVKAQRKLDHLTKVNEADTPGAKRFGMDVSAFR
jgi:hypothetical protein